MLDGLNLPDADFNAASISRRRLFERLRRRAGKSSGPRLGETSLAFQAGDLRSARKLA